VPGCGTPLRQRQHQRSLNVGALLAGNLSVTLQPITGVGYRRPRPSPRRRLRHELLASRPGSSATPAASPQRLPPGPRLLPEVLSRLRTPAAAGLTNRRPTPTATKD